MILFLDFDGVLHPISRPLGTFSQLELFEHTMSLYPGVRVVITSDWRLQFPIEVLCGYFSKGFRHRIEGVTPSIEGLELHKREKEIREWLAFNGEHPNWWLALDDSAWLFTPGCANLILTDPDMGFTSVIADELRKRLG